MFVGRQEELDRIDAALSGGGRLLTIGGPGGMGKSALVRRYVAQQGSSFPGGAAIADLTEAYDVQDLVLRAAGALGLPLGGPVSADAVASTLEHRGPSLLVLDGFEHLAETGRSVVEQWLERAPEARIVVTSRHLLRLGPEVRLHLSPLPFEEAVELFVHRALATGRRAAFSGEDLRAVRELVHHLEGIPLAIELVAARVGPARPQALLDAVRDAVVAGTHGEILDATLTWSWLLLSPEARHALARCAVFRGGFPLEAAEHVVGHPEARALLAELTDKSLVHEDGAGLRLYDTLRSWATARLSAMPGEEEEATERHAQWYRQRAAALGREAPTRAANAMGADAADLLAAYDYLLRYRPTEAAELLRDLRYLLEVRGPYDHYLDLLEQALAEDLPPKLAQELRANRGFALLELGQHGQARAELEAVLDGLPRSVAGRVQCDLGYLAAVEGRLDEAWARYEDAVGLLRGTSDLTSLASAMNAQAAVAVRKGNLELARERAAASLELATRSGDRVGRSNALEALGRLAVHEGRWQAGCDTFAEAHELDRATGRVSKGIRMVFGRATCLAHLGRVDEAEPLLRRALSDARALGSPVLETWVLLVRGRVRQARGDLEGADRDWQRAEQLAQSHRIQDAIGGVAYCQGLAAFERGDLPTARVRLSAALRAVPAAYDPARAPALATLAATRAASGDLDDARTLLAEADRLDGVPTENRILLEICRGLVELAHLERSPDPALRAELALRLRDLPHTAFFDRLLRLLGRGLERLPG